ncbi:MAG: DUF368 domain-containing protein [Eubacteriales bacterium]|nr:DUF368 domain-containing protein [Eubacteriales bacterium]
MRFENRHKQQPKEVGVSAFILMLKGFLMGAADIIPGVSGGTIALIVGVYEELIETISSYDGQMLSLLFARKWKELLERMNLRFLVPLAAGIIVAILSLANVMTYLLHHYEAYTFAVFFGLILGSSFLMIQDFERKPMNYLLVLIGALLPFWLIGFLPKETPATLWAFFLSAFIAICAMILPGISGSFILLVLGKYRQILDALKHPLQEGNLLIILVFMLGAVWGIISFAKLLKWLLERYHSAVFAFLIGMMLGSLRKLWPFGQGQEMFSLFGLWCFVLALSGIAIVLLIQYFSKRKAQ